MHKLDYSIVIGGSAIIHCVYTATVFSPTVMKISVQTNEHYDCSRKYKKNQKIMYLLFKKNTNIHLYILLAFHKTSCLRTKVIKGTEIHNI